MSEQLDKNMQNKSKREQELWALRHTAEHVLHTAMQNLYPSLKKAMGPATDDGFYFDFDLEHKISEENFPKIKEEMQKIIDANLSMIQKTITPDEARKIFQNNPYKLDWITNIEKRGETISVYSMGNADIDICSGPHVSSTGKVKAFNLLSVAGAYWHGDEKNKMLTRVYGTAFPSQKELDEYIALQEEAKKRDHRKLGKELDLFTFSELVGKGLPLYTQKGALIRRLLNEYVENVQSKEDYMQVWTPQIARAELFKISGHYDKYKENLFQVKSNYSEEELFLKPMNCPQHTQIYASKPRSYRDLPIRMTDFAMLYRDEKPGELNGLARVRSFSQDDCHIFCREDQIDEEVDRALSMTKEIMKTFGFKYRYRLSTSDKAHPEKYLGNPETWAKVEAWAEKIMKRNKIEYFDGPGEATFYAPKMDLMTTDALGREWQLSTVQIDYFLPERFNLTYIGQDGKEKSPIMIHRAIIGSPERFIMILLEHYAGAFPTWLTPVQVKVLPIADRHLEYSTSVAKKLKENDIRTELDDRKETLQAKIRDSQMEKVSYMLIIGDKEISSHTVAKRGRNGKDYGQISIDTFISSIRKEIDDRVIV